MEAEEDASHCGKEESASTSENSVNTSNDDVTEGTEHDEVSKSSAEDTHTISQIMIFQKPRPNPYYFSLADLKE